jgi:hypothetical protein
MSSNLELLKNLQGKYEEVARWSKYLGDLEDLLESRLLAKSDPEIQARSQATRFRAYKFLYGNEGDLVGIIGRSETGWLTRLAFAPRPAHGCTCPDWVRRHRACKHVLSLATLAKGLLHKQRGEATAALGSSDHAWKVAASVLEGCLNTKKDHLGQSPKPSSVPSEVPSTLGKG